MYMDHTANVQCTCSRHSDVPKFNVHVHVGTCIHVQNRALHIWCTCTCTCTASTHKVNSVK